MKTRAEAMTEYYKLLKEGKSPTEAYQIAIKGVPTQEDLLKEQADEQQKQGLAGVGGMLAGAVGTNYLVDALTGTGAGKTTTLSAPKILSANALGGSASGAGMAGGEASAAGLSGSLASAVPIAGALAGTYLGGKAAYDMIQGEKPDLAGRVTLGIATGGLSELANALLNRKTTRDYAKENTQNLLSKSDNTDYQNYVNTMREQYNSAPIDPSKPFAGKYGSWDEYKTAGLEAGDLTGVYGNINTFGEDWTRASQEQRQAATQALIDANLYDSKKGDVIITDEDRARQVVGSMLSGGQAQSPFQTISPLVQALNTRSKTLSPGIDKNGRRITY